ncbi:MAG: YicC family protein [Candidatus Omnitrophica bacterium]|nr:YicC family protein [Candidatus Omnitrophota bacterium]
MIQGMTGFGSAQVTIGAVKILVEIKTVNHRFFDLSFYTPSGFNAIENKIKQIIQKEIERGRITVSIKIIQKPTPMVALNNDVVKSYLDYAKKINKTFKLEGQLTVADIIKMPGVLDVQDTFVDATKIWPSLEKAIRRALKGVVLMRKSEGRALTRDMSDKLQRMTKQTKAIKSRSDAILKDAKKRLPEEEFSSFQKGIDINEELSRLQHYVDQIKILLKNSVSTGKKIDFIAQEMQRETNTVGSKLQDKIVSNSVIMMKSKIEKIREQAQNVE